MAVVSYNSVGGYSTGLTMTAVIDATGNITGVSGSFTGNFSGATGSFSRLLTLSNGLSAAGGVTLAGTFSGTTGSFSRLTTFNAGLSGDINISETNASGSMYLLMARGTGVTAVFADTTTTPLVYQASLGNLGLRGISLAYGNDRLYITPTQITATNTVTPTASYFYFIAQGGNYFQSQTLSQIGDIGAVNSALALSVDPSTRTMTWSDGYYLTGVTSGFFGVNRSPSGMCADYAVEINSPTGKGLQLIYNDYTGAASNWVNMDVSSGGNYTLRPSGGLATVTGTLNVSAGISAAGGVTLAGTFSGTTAAFTGLVSSTVGFSGSGTNLKNIVTTFNGLSGAVTGASLGANTFTELNTFNAGISASALTVAGGATFSGNVYTDTILSIGSQLNINDKANTRVVIGDYSANGNSTNIYLRDNVSALNLANPYGNIQIGDPDSVDSGYFIFYNAAAGYLDGGGSALTNFGTGSFSGLLTASAGISAAGATFSGRLDMNGGYSEAGATATQATNTITFNAASGNTQKFVPSAVVNTVNFTNIATTSTQCTSATLIFLHGATPYGLTTGTFSVQLAGVTKTVKWSGGSAPTLTNTANKTDILNFLTYDGGTTWLGFVGGLNF